MKIIDSRKQLNRKKNKGEIYDSHHIIPKCMGGKNSPTNKVLLTPREHFIVHLLLTKMVNYPHKRSMYCALVRFLGKNLDRSLVKINSRTYQHIIENNRKNMMGKNNPFYGKSHTKETKEYISKINKELNLREKNSFYGKTHTKETKELISKQRCQPIRVYFGDGTIQDFTQRKFLGTYLNMSHHLGAKLCNKKYQYLLSKYNILKIEKI